MQACKIYVDTCTKQGDGILHKDNIMPISILESSFSSFSRCADGAGEDTGLRKKDGQQKIKHGVPCKCGMYRSGEWGTYWAVTFKCPSGHIVCEEYYLIGVY